MKIYEDNENYSLNCIYNVDETNFSTVQSKQRKILECKGKKKVSHSHAYIIYIYVKGNFLDKLQQLPMYLSLIMNTREIFVSVIQMNGTNFKE